MSEQPIKLTDYVLDTLRCALLLTDVPLPSGWEVDVTDAIRALRDRARAVVDNASRDQWDTVNPDLIDALREVLP